MLRPNQILSALGIPSDEVIDELANRRRAFEGFHLGLTDLPIGKVLDLMHANPTLRPPRSGHLGNWEEIARGRAGAMDFNKAICAGGYGFPIVYCSTRTEAMSDSQPPEKLGDWIYLPGSLIENGQRRELPLLTWDGHDFVARPRNRELFCPFVLTEIDGVRQPLTAVHRSRLARFPEFRFRLDSEIMMAHAGQLRVMLPVLLDHASRQKNARAAFADIISHAAKLDGTAGRCTMRREGDGYWVDDQYFADAAAVTEAALSVFRAVTEPEWFFANLRGQPATLPVLSSVLQVVLLALFATHFTDGGSSESLQPFNVHLHWGARDMAGYPPRRKGYFISRTKIQSFRGLTKPLLDQFPQLSPIAFALLPAAVFMLCPTSAHPRDAELLADLFSAVRPETVTENVERLTQEWKTRNAGELSAYFRQRFGLGRGILQAVDRPTSSEPVHAPGFRELTLRQACAIVGRLAETPDTL